MKTVVDGPVGLGREPTVLATQNSFAQSCCPDEANELTAHRGIASVAILEFRGYRMATTDDIAKDRDSESTRHVA